MIKKFNANSVVTWDDINNDVYAVEAAVRDLCEYDTDGLDDWLSASATNLRETVKSLAKAWDQFQASN